ncbi:MAG TPA: tyrosine-type recombinase/integrase [Polyangia bacterium]|nr:tyrosine-type recombinase/integrase [Polyangia bacterium]
MTKWVASLTNRNAANDRTMVTRHLIPRFGTYVLDEITVHQVMDWLADLKKEGTLSGQSQRHAMATLSRFWGWCLLWKHTDKPNPVKSVPTQARPVVVHAKRETLEDEKKLSELIVSLPPPVNLMLALANRTAMRLGEVCGLRMGDLDDLEKGFIRVAHSYGGPLKEDRRGEGKIKKVPAPVDAAEALKLHLARRRLQGAGPDDLVFMPVKAATRKRVHEWAGFRKENIRDLWWEACKKVGLVDDDERPTVTWYGSTRTTAATRAAKADVDLKQIADSLGHASDETTRKHYAHFQRENFDPKLRLPMLPVLGPSRSKKVRTTKAK